MSELPVPRAVVLPAPAEPAAVARPRRAMGGALLPAIAAGSFAAGAAVMSVFSRKRAFARMAPRRRLLSRHGGRGLRRGRRGEPLEIVTSRSLLLDVHLLGRSR